MKPLFRFPYEVYTQYDSSRFLDTDETVPDPESSCKEVF